MRNVRNARKRVRLKQVIIDKGTTRYIIHMPKKVFSTVNALYPQLKYRILTGNLHYSDNKDLPVTKIVHKYFYDEWNAIQFLDELIKQKEV